MWVTKQLFVEWVNLVFGLDIKENKIFQKALLVLDNAPDHLPNLEEYILKGFKFIKVLYFPPNTTFILHKRFLILRNFSLSTCSIVALTETTTLTLGEFWKDQYNIMICLRIIDMVWQRVTKMTLTSTCKKLWPEVVSETNFERLKPKVAMVEEIVSLSKSM